MGSRAPWAGVGPLGEVGKTDGELGGDDMTCVWSSLTGDLNARLYGCGEVLGDPVSGLRVGGGQRTRPESRKGGSGGGRGSLRGSWGPGGGGARQGFSHPGWRKGRWARVVSPPTPVTRHTWAYLRTTCTALTPGCSSLCGEQRRVSEKACAQQPL